MNREETILRMATAYYDFLKTNKTIFFSNPDVYIGIKEGLNKFLSNVCISLYGKYTLNSVDFISDKALKQIQINQFNNLVYEHMIPKDLYIQKPCLQLAQSENLTFEYIYNILNQYWYIALITKYEDNILNALHLRRKMPDDWDNKNIFARYEKANISLISNLKK
jgi:hypothetical protein